MPDSNYLSEIEREDGTVLTIKDAEARAEIAAQLEQINTNTTILSQTYNSADCNVSVFLCQDNGAINESTYYNTSENKMHFRMRWSKNQSRYWDTEDEVWTYKYRYEYFGLIATNNAEKITWLEINIPETANETYVKKSTVPDSQSENTGGYTWNKSNVNVGDIWYIRPYIVMTDLQFGNQFIKYGAVYKVTAGVPCTIECDTLSCTELTAKEQANENNISTNERLGYLKNYNLSPIIGGHSDSAGIIDRKECFLSAGTYYVSWKNAGAANSGTATMTFYDYNDTSVGQATITHSRTRTEVSVTLTDDCETIELRNDSNEYVSIVQVMITEMANQSFVPYAPSNAVLYVTIDNINTVLEGVL
jgi:hypothetical protein